MRFAVYYQNRGIGRRPSMRSNWNAKRMLPGWDMHVVYVNGKSVSRSVYQRSPRMTEQELNMLLHLQGNGQRWAKVEKAEQEVGGEVPTSSSDKKEPSAFGYEMHTR